MQVQTSEIQIYGPDDSLFIITGKDLGVDEARCILIKPDAFRYQLLIVSPGQPVRLFFIRDMWQY